MSPDLTRKLPTTRTLFIYARAETGPRMPVAMLRKSVRELPDEFVPDEFVLDEFVLDDRSSMSPALKISGFKNVLVTARISVSGDAMPASGNLIASSGPVAVGTRNLRIEIDETVHGDATVPLGGMSGAFDQDAAVYRGKRWTTKKRQRDVNLVTQDLQSSLRAGLAAAG